jgi:hypothetical protein
MIIVAGLIEPNITSAKIAAANAASPFSGEEISKKLKQKTGCNIYDALFHILTANYFCNKRQLWFSATAKIKRFDVCRFFVCRIGKI